jgi:hypothetical protein
VEHPVRLSVPGTHHHVRVARLTAAVVAERLNFDIEDIDDVLIAIDELTNALIEAGPSSDIDYRFTQYRGVFVAMGNATVMTPVNISNLSRRLLTAAVDSFEVAEIDGVARFRVTKRATPARR